MVTLSESGSPIAEDGGVSSITATLSSSVSCDVTVSLGYTGTATGGGVDYTASGTQIIIGAGSTTGSVTITGDDDAIFEGAETVIVDITSVTNGTESGSQQETVTITDDDSAPSVTLSESGSPIAENGGVSTITATLSNPSTSAVTVDLGYGGTATGGGTDYTASGTQIIIGAGSTTGSVTITGDDDAIFEGAETVIVDITSVTNGTESGSQQETVTITDDDSAPTVTLSELGSPIAENGGVSTITATLSNPSTSAVTVDLGYGGTATGGGTDYTASGAQIIIGAGSTTGSVTITGDDDAIFEGAETVIVDITSVTNGTESGSQQETVTITDDDSAPTVTLSELGSPIAENGGVSTITATLSNPSTSAVTVDLGYGGTATGGGTDYTASGTQIIIGAGSTTGSVTITGDDDAIFEGAETVIVDITSVTNGTESGSQQETVTITDDDSAPSVTLSESGSPIAENGGVSTITATLSNPSTSAVTVDLGYGGTATGGGTDYTASGTQIIIGAGSTTGSVTITGDDDAIFEGAETVIVDITSVTNGTESGSQQETVTITDDDSAPSVTLSESGSPIAENGGVSTITATLSNPSTSAVTVDLGYGGTATGGGTDYTASGAQIIIGAGSTTGNVTITGDDDAIFEGAETVIVDITSVTNGTESGSQQETVTITDDDSAPTVTLSELGSPIAENGGVSTITATLSNPSTSAVTVDLGYGGTATGGGTDYTASGAQIIIGAGSTTGNVTITGDDDAIFEGAETVIVDITSVTNGTESGSQQETVTITDDDSAPTVTLSELGSPIAENGGVSTITATLSNPSTSAVTVDLGYGGTATGGGTDYTASGAQIIIGAGSTTGSVTITGDDDAIFEGAETVIVDITSVTNGTESGASRRPLRLRMMTAHLRSP